MAKKVSKKKVSKKKAKKKKNTSQQEVASQPLAVEIHETIGFTQEEREKYVRAVNLAVRAISSKKFYDRLMAKKFTNTGGFTNQQIYDKLMSGADNINKTEDHDIDLFITMYYKNNKVVGHTNPGTCKIWVNRKFFSQYSDAEIACNMLHEYMHKLGFDHKSASEKTSVPYALGYMLEEIINEGFEEEVPEVIIEPNPEPEAPVEVEVPAEEPHVIPDPEILPMPEPEVPVAVAPVKKASVFTRLARWFRNLF